MQVHKLIKQGSTSLMELIYYFCWLWQKLNTDLTSFSFSCQLRSSSGTTPFISDTDTLWLPSPTSAQWAQSKTRDLPEHSSLFKPKRFLLCKSKTGRKSVAASDRMPRSPNKLIDVISSAGRSRVTNPKWLPWHDCKWDAAAERAPKSNSIHTFKSRQKNDVPP